MLFLVSGHCTSAEDVKSRVFDSTSSVTFPMHALSPRTDHIENRQSIPKHENNYRYETSIDRACLSRALGWPDRPECG